MWLGVKGRRQAHRPATSDNRISKATLQDLMCLAPSWEMRVCMKIIILFQWRSYLENLSINMCKICNKIHQKSTKYPLLEPPWGSLGTILAALGNQDAPKRRPRAPRRRQHGPTWFNLAPTWRPRAPQILPKRSPRPSQIHFYNKFGASVAPFSICIDFYWIFWWF